MIGDRARDQGDWMEMSQAMVDAGAVAMEAAQAKNIDALVDAGNPARPVIKATGSKAARMSSAAQDLARERGRGLLANKIVWSSGLKPAIRCSPRQTKALTSTLFRRI